MRRAKGTLKIGMGRGRYTKRDGKRVKEGEERERKRAGGREGIG